MASTIGIKIANGEFYSLVEENSSVKKRLILTTVHDKQRSVQIDLYKSFTKTMADAFYIGSLVVENIKPKPKGEPSIEMVIASTADGNISADATDMDASSLGEHHSLNVSLKSLDDDNREYDIPDFELEHGEQPPSGLYEKARVLNEETKKPFPVLIAAVMVLVLLAVVFALWYTLFRAGSPLNIKGSSAAPPAAALPDSTPSPAVSRGNAEAEITAVEPKPAEPARVEPAVEPAAAPLPEAPVIEAPAAAPAAKTTAPRTRTPAPVASYKVPSVIPRNGAPYTIRWGDTLWDIAGAFYRNPWLYPRIARFNNIRNPDLIISGTTIRIPPRN